MKFSEELWLVLQDAQKDTPFKTAICFNGYFLSKCCLCFIHYCLLLFKVFFNVETLNYIIFEGIFALQHFFACYFCPVLYMSLKTLRLRGVRVWHFCQTLPCCHGPPGNRQLWHRLDSNIKSPDDRAHIFLLCHLGALLHL